MRSRSLFFIGYALLFLSMGLTILVFVGMPTTVFTLEKGVQPSLELLLLDSSPTIVFLTGIGFLLGGQLKQRWEEDEEQ
jgi:hypothetical protein